MSITVSNRNLTGGLVASTVLAFPGSLLVFVILLLLKVNAWGSDTPVVDWSWAWIFAPFWLPFAVIAALGIIVFLVALLAACISDWSKARDRRKYQQRVQARRQNRYGRAA